MRRLAAAPILLAILACRSATPRDLPPSAIPGAVRSLPDYVRLFITGLAFHEGRLYAGSNIGLLEIDGDRPVALHQWSSWDAVVEPPYRDEGGAALWAWLARSFDLVRRDAQGWALVDLPPSEGGYTRGDFLDGFRGTSVGRDFWIQGAGRAWRWNRESSTWTRVRLPRGALYGLAPTSEGLLAVVNPPSDQIRVKFDFEVHVLDGTTWSKVAEITLDELVKDVVGAASGGYATTSRGKVLRFDRRGIREIETPGTCEALASTSTGTVVAIFLHRGLYRREGDAWKQLAPYPYGPEEGKHWAHIAEDRGRVAFATSEYATIPSHDKGTRAWTGTSAIWVLKGDRLEKVELK